MNALRLNSLNWLLIKLFVFYPILMKLAKVVVPKFYQNRMKNKKVFGIHQGFSSFFAKFLPYLMIFQSGVSPKVLQNFENSSNNAKNFPKK